MPRYAIFEPLPSDRQSGAIVQLTSKSAAAMAADPRAYIEIPADAPADLDLTHSVVAGALVEKAN